MLTAQGYTRQTFDMLFEESAAKAREFFGEDIRTDELSVMGKILRICTYGNSKLEELAELIYYAMWPQSATGTSLDRLCELVVISRNAATPASYRVKVTGEAGAVIPVGFLVATESEINFYNTAEAVIGEDGTCEIVVECTEAGEIGNVGAAAITEIANPEADIDSVEGVAVVELGMDTESDTALRKRFYAAREGLGSSNEAAISAALMRVPTVISADVVANESDTTDASGRPPNSFECYVQGGEDFHKEIAEIIYEKKPLGIKSHGQISVTILDSAGRERTVKFSHTPNITVYVKLTITTDTTFDDVDSTAQIKENISEYINGLGIGADVVYSALYGKIHSVPGVVDVTELKLSTDGATWNAANIDIPQNAAALCQNVEVTK